MSQDQTREEQPKVSAADIFNAMKSQAAQEEERERQRDAHLARYAPASTMDLLAASELYDAALSDPIFEEHLLALEDATELESLLQSAVVYRMAEEKADYDTIINDTTVETSDLADRLLEHHGGTLGEDAIQEVVGEMAASLNDYLKDNRVEALAREAEVKLPLESYLQKKTLKDHLGWIGKWSLVTLGIAGAAGASAAAYNHFDNQAHQDRVGYYQQLTDTDIEGLMDAEGYP